ncbi:actin-related protein 2/3 complex subunit 3, partial [Gorgonomyces haynaldii]
AYHSQYNDDPNIRSVGNIALLPIKSKIRGLLPPADENTDDIIDEAIGLFRANILFRNFDIKGNADRVLIYLTLYIQECLQKLTKLPNQQEGLRTLSTHAVTNFAIPGDASFPLNAMYERPQTRQDAETMKQYLSHLRQETSLRLAQRVFEDDKPSKWWLCFTKRKFMNLASCGTMN